MKHLTVRQVMTERVVSVAPQTPFKEIAELLAVHRINAVPVVADDGRVVGIVSERDLLYKESAQVDTNRRRRFGGRPSRQERRKADARNAGELMSAPAVTARPDTRLSQAAKLLIDTKVKQLPVTNGDGILVGIVARRDLLGAFLRSDAEIRDEIRQEVFTRALCLEPGLASVAVRDGIVTLEGSVQYRTTVGDAESLARRVDGVVDVVNNIGFAVDDTRLGLAPVSRPEGSRDLWLGR